MAPWAQEIMACFRGAKPDLESDFTPAAYNKLLNTLFPVNTPYTVFPQVHHHSELSSTSPRTTFTIYYQHTPVFILDLFSYGSLTRLSARQAAESHIRMHMRDLLPYCPLPMLNAVSVFGTRMAFYSVTPESGIMSARIQSQDADKTGHEHTPADIWDCDVLEDDGAIRLKEVVNKIRNQCENL